MFEARATEDLKPPYAHYKQFRAFLNAFQASPKHSRVEVTTTLHSLNDSARHNIRSTLRYLRLIDENSVPTPRLIELINSGGDRQRMVFEQMLEAAYPYLLGPQADEFDVLNATADEIAEKFRSVGVTSETTLKRCVIFFRNALKEIRAGRDSEDTTPPYYNGDSGSAALYALPSDGARRNGESEGKYPPLPPYEADWPTDMKRWWLELLHNREVRKEK